MSITNLGSDERQVCCVGSGQVVSLVMAGVFICFKVLTQ